MATERVQEIKKRQRLSALATLDRSDPGLVELYIYFKYILLCVDLSSLRMALLYPIENQIDILTWASNRTPNVSPP